MRQVFTSARLENVEAVADLLRESGIEVRITDGRSYKGRRRNTASYTEREPKKAAVWVVKADDQVRAREILRGAGLLDTTRGPGGFNMPMFRSQEAIDAGDSSRKRAFRIKLILLAGISVVLMMALFKRPQEPVHVPASTAAPVLAQPPFDGSVAPTLAPVALAALQHELPGVDTPVACLGVDGRDAAPTVLAALSGPGATLAPLSQCVRVADSDRGSYQRSSGREATLVEVGGFKPSAPDAGTVETSAYHHQLWGDYKTLEVRRVDGAWKVTRVLKHVAMQG